MPRKNARPAARKRLRQQKERAARAAGVPPIYRRIGSAPGGAVTFEECGRLTRAQWFALHASLYGEGRP